MLDINKEVNNSQFRQKGNQKKIIEIEIKDLKYR